MLLLATLGEHVDEAVEYFAQQARDTAVDEFGTAAIETYLILLRRVGRSAEALAAYSEFSADGISLSPYAPTPLALARESGDWEIYLAMMRDRDDAVGYAIGQLEQG